MSPNLPPPLCFFVLFLLKPQRSPLSRKYVQFWQESQIISASFQRKKKKWTRQRDPFSRKGCNPKGDGQLRLRSSVPPTSCFHMLPAVFFLENGWSMILWIFSRRNPSRPEANPRVATIFSSGFHMLKAIWLKWICPSTERSLQNLTCWLLKTRKWRSARLLRLCGGFWKQRFLVICLVA